MRPLTCANYNQCSSRIIYRRRRHRLSFFGVILCVCCCLLICFATHMLRNKNAALNLLLSILMMERQALSRFLAFGAIERRGKCFMQLLSLSLSHSEAAAMECRSRYTRRYLMMGLMSKYKSCREKKDTTEASHDFVNHSCRSIPHSAQ